MKKKACFSILDYVEKYVCFICALFVQEKMEFKLIRNEKECQTEGSEA